MIYQSFTAYLSTTGSYRKKIISTCETLIRNVAPWFKINEYMRSEVYGVEN